MKSFRLLRMSDNQIAKRTFIRDFCSLPKRLYSSRDNMEDPSTMKSLLEGMHPLNPYFKLEPFIVYDGKRPVGRFAITSYEADTTAYLGFFECENNKEASRFLFGKAEQYCRDKGFSRIEGPVNASFWVGYRLKINRFDVAPYTGEPYNKDYYYDLFLDAGFKVSQHYTSNLYRSIDESYVNDKYEERFSSFTGLGYRIESPEPENFDKCLGDVYRMVTELYSDFPIFKNVSEHDFKKVFSSYKQIMNMSMTKIAYYKDRAVGFYVSVPDYSNIVYHINPLNLIRILKLKKNPKRYVMLYMGVEPEHQGLGKAIVYSVMKELMKSGLPSIGALARDGKITQKYAFDDVTDVYEYVLLEKEI
ncbi:hypothetical protein [Butyrivibrio sp. XPD2006]|uniref:hypothetical protein n=1 Tax=Butyrivibrio sp. XPD2006 TaxID=1280668 RepID=UPI0003B3CBD9|nr:hypothetical protein [Butyrivibrio sp. XPD2006]